MPVLALILSIIFCTSCVLPPRGTSSELADQIGLLSRAKGLAENGNYKKAEELILRSGLVTSEVYNDLGFIVQAQNRPLAAEKYYKLALDKNPENVAARVNLARLYFNTARYDESLKLLKKAYFQTSGKENFILQNLVLTNLSVGKLDESVCLAEEIYEHSPDPRNLEQYVRLLLLKGKVGLAARYNSEPLSESLKAQIYYLLGENEQAKTLLGSVSNLDYISELLFAKLSNIEDPEIDPRCEQDFFALNPDLEQAVVPLHKKLCS